LVPHPTRLDPVRYRYLRLGYQGRGLSLPPRFRWGLVAIAVAVYVANFVAGDRGLLRKAEVKKELSVVGAEVAKLRDERSQLEREVLLKENDPFSLEKVAREKYMMVGPDEKIFRFEENETPAEAPAPEASQAGLDAPEAH
jgi:cell division protein FtsB